jgi:hypothetical protein
LEPGRVDAWKLAPVEKARLSYGRRLGIRLRPFGEATRRRIYTLKGEL